MPVEQAQRTGERKKCWLGTKIGMLRVQDTEEMPRDCVVVCTLRRAADGGIDVLLLHGEVSKVKVETHITLVGT